MNDILKTSDRSDIRFSGVNNDSPAPIESKPLAQFIAKKYLTKEQFDIEITGLAINSNAVQPGYLFFGFPGEVVDGRRFIAEAMARGALVVVVESGMSHDWMPEKCVVPIIEIPHLQKKVGLYASRFYDNPSDQLRLVGVTGTNGKSSCIHMIAQALSNADIQCAQIGTLGIQFPDGHLIRTNHTTPEALTMQSALAHWLRWKHEGSRQESSVSKAVAVEVSSHGLEQNRVEGCQFHTAVFTNLTRDHLDYHATLGHYAAAKKKLFTQYPVANAVINVDDEVGISLLEDLITAKKSAQQSAQSSMQLLTYSIEDKNPCDDFSDADIQHFSVVKLTQNQSGISVKVQTPTGEIDVMNAYIWGAYNVSNLLATIACLTTFNVSNTNIAALLSNASLPDGRMQLIDRYRGQAGPKVFVDYAHTPDAVRNALSALREHCGLQTKVTVVLGCGGNRDVGKRAQMGEAVGSLANKMIITSDNPRFESPAIIARQVREGIRGPQASELDVSTEPVRRAAIWRAVIEAQEDECIIVLGKGHESEQQMGAVTLPLKDEDIVHQAIEQRKRRVQWVQNTNTMISATTFLWDLSELVELTGGRLEGDSTLISQVSVDSRTIGPGSLFVALVGKQLNGHSFVKEAVAKGAVSAVIDESHLGEITDLIEPIPCIVVKNTTVALGQIAKGVRDVLAAPVIALVNARDEITVGDIKVKEVLRRILARQGQVMAAEDVNDPLCVPLSLLRMRVDDQYAVVEMQADYAEEMEYLSGLAEPEVALVLPPAVMPLDDDWITAGVEANQTSTAKMGATVYETVYKHVKASGFAAINLDDLSYEAALESSRHLRQITYSIDLDNSDKQNNKPKADVALVGYEKVNCEKSGREDGNGKGGVQRIKLCVRTPRGTMSFSMQLLERNQWSNVLAVIVAAQLLGVTNENMVAELELLELMQERRHEKALDLNVATTDDAGGVQ